MLSNPLTEYSEFPDGTLYTTRTYMIGDFDSSCMTHHSMSLPRHFTYDQISGIF